MDWQAFWDRQAKDHTDPHLQVSRHSRKMSVDEALLDRIAEHIAKHLDLQPEDRLLDVCCGNGMLSSRLAVKCGEVVGVDLSEGLVQQAQSHFPRTNISYLQGDATRLGEVVNGPFDKINLYFSFQYLDSFSKGKQALTEMLGLLAPGGTIFIGDVPDMRYLSVFYPSWIQRMKYHLNLMLGRSLMGKFWSEKELGRIAKGLDVSVSCLEQAPDLPYAHYRVDYVVGG
ncbi:MAG: class I SAM-dependent methyltransferase [Bacteroidota bacterium]